MSEILIAISLAIALEGALYAMFPEAMKKFMAQVGDQPDSNLRFAGMTAVVFGVVCIWLIKS